MKNNDHINVLNEYVKKQENSDKIIAYGLIAFVIMASFIVYYAIGNKKLKQDIKILTFEKELIETRRNYANANADYLASLVKIHNNQLDSLKKEFENYKKEKDSSFAKVQKEYNSLIAKMKVNNSVNRESVDSQIDNINRIVSKNKNVQDKKFQKISEQVTNYKSFSNSTFYIYLFYTKSKYGLADTLFNKALKISKYSLNKPELISYDFQSSIKYFHADDKKEAQLIGSKLNIPAQLEKSEHKIQKGYIEVWLGK
ncbi:MAG: hypothetical protein IPJ13_01440 [Saprospiraceae bacterium]|nr:hypothetical protein [Saprospiraceae bacterium]